MGVYIATAQSTLIRELYQFDTTSVLSNMLIPFDFGWQLVVIVVVISKQLAGN